AAFGVVAVLMALPYLQVARLHPDNARTVEYLRHFCAHPRAFGVAPERSWLWGRFGEASRAAYSYPDETSLIPGLAVAGLALLGLIYAAWRLRWRVALAVGVAGFAGLALGPNLGGDGDPGYVTLF